MKSEINETNLASAITAWPVIEAWFDPLHSPCLPALIRVRSTWHKGLVAALAATKLSECALGNTPLLSCYFVSRRVDVPR